MSPRRSSRLAPASLLLVVAAAALWAYPRPLRDLSPGERIEVVIHGIQGRRSELVWELEGSSYRSKEGSLKVTTMRALRSVALSSRAPCHPLDEIGFVVDDGQFMRQTRERFPWLEGPPPEVDLRRAAELTAYRQPRDNAIGFEINLGGEPAIELSGRAYPGYDLGYFPVWQVQAGERQWETRCPQLSQLAQALRPGNGIDWHPLDTESWSERFYHQQVEQLGEAWGRQRLEEAHRSWPGYAQLADSYYEVTDFDPVQEQEWAVSLFQMGPVAIKSATFTFRATEGLDWIEVLAEIERARLASRRQEWLTHPLQLTPINDSLREAWTEAGLEGRPAFHLNSASEDFLLSADGRICLVDAPSDGRKGSTGNPSCSGCSGRGGP